MAEELAPGFVIGSLEYKEEEARREELNAFREELLTKKVEDSNAIKAKKAEIIRKVHQDILKGYQVDITDEMVELELDKQIRGMLLESYGYQLMNKHLLDADDLDW